MYKSKKILAIIPARGGSKGIKHKNLKKIRNISLVSHAINFAKKNKEIDKIIVSTDSNKIALEAKKNKVDFPFFRPKKISGDKVSAYDVLIHTLIKSEEFFNKKYDYIVMLEPTSPLRTSKEFKDCLRKILKFNYDAIWTVSKIDSRYHPLKQLVISDQLMSLYNSRGKRIVFRQALKETYIRNGAIYIFSRKCLMKYKNIYGKKLGFHISKREHISIDTPKDLNNVKKLFKKNTL